MRNMLLFIVAEHVRPNNAFQLWIKMREEVGAAKQIPIKEQNIIKLHKIENRQKPSEERPKAEIMLHSVPHGKRQRSHKQQQCDCDNGPADRMCTGKPLLFIRDRRQIFFGRRTEKTFVLNKTNRST